MTRRAKNNSTNQSSGLEAYLDVEEREALSLRSLGGVSGRAAWDSGCFRKLLAEMRFYPLPLLGGLGFVLIGTVATLLEPRLFGLAIDKAIIPKNSELLAKMVAGLFILILFRAGLVIFQSYLFEILGQQVAQGLRVKLFSQLQRLPVSIYDRNPAGRLLTRVTNDIASLSDMFSAGFVSMVSNFLLVIGILVWLIFLNLKLGLISVSVVPMMVLFSAYFSACLKIAYRDAEADFRL